jgi:uncharacterized protein with HEPN domain
MRNALTHGYFDIDLDRIRATVQARVPALAAQIPNASVSA